MIRVVLIDDHVPLLMDVRMPRLDGIEATRRLIAAGSRARVLVVTTFDHGEYVVQALGVRWAARRACPAAWAGRR